MATDEKNTNGGQQKGATPQSASAADVDRQEQSATTVSNEKTSKDSLRTAEQGETDTTDKA